MAGIVVSLALLWWTFRDVRVSEVLAHARSARWSWLILTVVLATLTFPVRLLRWRLILRDADGRPLPLGALWHAVAVGFMANNLLPARAGEVARAYVASKQLENVRFTTALASIGVERVFDGLTVVALLTFGLLAPSFPSHATMGSVPLARVVTNLGILFAAALVVALLVVYRPAFWLGIAGRVSRATLPERAAARILSILEGLVGGLTVLRSPARFAGVVVWSFALWLVNGASFWACFVAFGIAVPPEGALVMQGVLAFAVAVPSTPGYVGVFEAAIRGTLGIYGVASSLAVGYALTYHITTFIPITLLGLWSLSRVGMHIGELRARPTT